MPMSRAWTGTFVTSRSPMRTRPLSGATKPATMRNSVVLPEPDGPSRLVKPPSRKRAWMLSSTVAPA